MTPMKSQVSFRAKEWGAIHSTKMSGHFGPKLNGSVRSNWKSFEKKGPPFEVDHFSRSDRLEFWLNGSRPMVSSYVKTENDAFIVSSHVKRSPLP